MAKGNGEGVHGETGAGNQTAVAGINTNTAGGTVAGVYGGNRANGAGVAGVNNGNGRRLRRRF